MIKWYQYAFNSQITYSLSSGSISLIYGLINIRLYLIYSRWRDIAASKSEPVPEPSSLSMIAKSSTTAEQAMSTDAKNGTDVNKHPRRYSHTLSEINTDVKVEENNENNDPQINFDPTQTNSNCSMAPTDSLNKVNSESEMNKNQSDNESKQKREREYINWFNIISFCFSIIGAAYIFCGTSSGYKVAGSFGFGIVHFVISVFLLILIRITEIQAFPEIKEESNVRVEFKKDPIEVFKETMYMLVLQLFLLLAMLILMILPMMRFPMMIWVDLSAFAQGIIPLIFPLYHINKMKKNMEQAMKMMKRNKNPSENPRVYQKPLNTFLEENITNYQHFLRFLKQCFAEENILFYERACILYHVILSLIKANDAKYEENKGKEIIHMNTFKYLKTMHRDFRKEIGDKTKFEDVKENIYVLYRSIMHEYVEDGSENEINISWETRNELIVLFGDDECVNKFESFDDFLNIFDKAMEEVYQLMFAMYQYRFKQFEIEDLRYVMRSMNDLNLI